MSPACKCGHPEGTHVRGKVPISPYTPVVPTGRCLVTGCECKQFREAEADDAS